MATCIIELTADILTGRAFKKQATSLAQDYVCNVPDDVLINVLLEKLEVSDLCRLAVVSQRFKSIAYNEARWSDLYQTRWGQPTAVMQSAHKLAGGWRTLFAAKHVTEKESEPWIKPSDYEINASIEMLTAGKCESPEKELGVLFLVDGSGSVQEEDFTAMTNFINTAATTFQQTVPDCKLGVVQFSNDVKIEVAPQVVSHLESFKTSVQEMVRMNGGTNIATSIQKAGQLLKKNLSSDAHRVVVLLTDGRVDSYQAREAAATAGRLADEQEGVVLWAFGVGRGVDRSELLRIVGAAGRASGPAENRYMELYVREEVPW